MSDAFQVACIQSGPLGRAVKERRDGAVRAAEGAAGADLIVLPELWATGYFPFNDYAATAEAIDGPTVMALATAARTPSGASVALGTFVEASEAGLHNTMAFLAPLVGFAGRASEKMLAHIKELVQIGVEAPQEPQETPTFYRLDPALVTTGPSMVIESTQSSGEVEPVCSSSSATSTTLGVEATTPTRSRASRDHAQQGRLHEGRRPRHCALRGDR